MSSSNSNRVAMLAFSHRLYHRDHGVHYDAGATDVSEMTSCVVFLCVTGFEIDWSPGVEEIFEVQGSDECMPHMQGMPHGREDKSFKRMASPMIWQAPPFEWNDETIAFKTRKIQCACDK
jgi:hypothetical protein